MTFRSSCPDMAHLRPPAMQSSSVQLPKLQSQRDFYRSLQTTQLPGACGEPMPLSPPPRKASGSAHTKMMSQTPPPRKASGLVHTTPVTQLPSPPKASRSANKKSVAPVTEVSCSYPYKQPWTTISLPMPRDHFAFAVFAAMCCLPLGLVAVYRSAQCKDAIQRGDIYLARVRSRQAKKLSYWSMGFGLLCLVAALIGFGIYFASLYRQDLKVWMAGRETRSTTLDSLQDDRPEPSDCCMQA
ncbi:hypothetical protein LSAT2_001511 [Lamellibrachia satsuma]|nr:hypothetical protein LSAT2_001511 [Lamellibrachia satsuma]